MALMKCVQAQEKYGISLSLVKKVLDASEIPSLRVDVGKKAKGYLFDSASFETGLAVYILNNKPKEKSAAQKEKLKKNLAKARAAKAKKAPSKKSLSAGK